MPLESSVKVIVRIRPVGLSNSTTDLTQGNSGIAADEGTSSIIVDRDKKGQSDFRFSGVIAPTSNQETLFQQCNLIDDVISGVNCCVMAYGQTGKLSLMAHIHLSYTIIFPNAIYFICVKFIQR